MAAAAAAAPGASTTAAAIVDGCVVIFRQQGRIVTDKLGNPKQNFHLGTLFRDLGRRQAKINDPTTGNATAVDYVGKKGLSIIAKHLIASAGLSIECE